MVKTYEETVKERMMKNFSSELMGGTFNKVKYPHIFLEQKDNFIDGCFPTKKCLKGSLTDSDIKYHYAEHLNSSQTMCIAFFKKFFESETREYLLAEILMMTGIDISGGNEFTDAVFEYVPDIKEGTNFDFYLKLANGQQLTWEIKFTESEFGCTSLDRKRPSRYIEKWKDVYTKKFLDCAYNTCDSVVCDRYECISGGKLKNTCCDSDKCGLYDFYAHYQIRRNILYAKKKGDYVLFLTPKENYALDEGRAYIDIYARKCGTDCIRNIYWEELIETTLRVVSCDAELLEYYTKFKTKYFG